MIQIYKSQCGVWGNGTVGQSVARYLNQHGARVTIYDRDCADHHCDDTTGISYAPESCIHTDAYDYVIPSPGVNINMHPLLLPWCISEYDIYAYACQIPHIGITGSVGKTTITSLVTHALSTSGISAHAGGNIGIPMCDLLMQRSQPQYHVLELSSFQLEHIKHAAPDIAVITNFYPNHLDRHNTIEAYFHAKCNILRYQRADQHAIIPISLRSAIALRHRSRCSVIASSEYEYNAYAHTLYPNDTVYYASSRQVYRIDKTQQWIGYIPPSISFSQNWLFVAAILDLLQTPAQLVDIPTSEHTEHRMEYIGTYLTIAWYNDSKATIMPATYAAALSLASQETTLILGGMSKGVDRTPYISALSNTISCIICFGQEADTLYNICVDNNIQAHRCWSLQEAVTYAFHNTPQGGNILFSPGGSSFDQFTSYQDRGNQFKQLVATYKK